MGRKMGEDSEGEGGRDLTQGLRPVVNEIKELSHRILHEPNVEGSQQRNQQRLSSPFRVFGSSYPWDPDQYIGSICTIMEIPEDFIN